MSDLKQRCRAAALKDPKRWDLATNAGGQACALVASNMPIGVCEITATSTRVASTAPFPSLDDQLYFHVSGIVAENEVNGRDWRGNEPEHAADWRAIQTALRMAEPRKSADFQRIAAHAEEMAADFEPLILTVALALFERGRLTQADVSALLPG